MTCPVGFYGPTCQYPITVRNMDALLEYGRITQEQYDAYLETLAPSKKWERTQVLRPNGVSVETVLLAFIVAKLSRTEKGLEVIKVLGKEFLKGIFDTLHALGQASAGNLVAAWANPYLVNLVLNRFGFVHSQGSSEFKLGLSVIAGAQVAEGFVDTFQGFFPHSSPEPSEFPSMISYSARTEGDTVKEEVTAQDIDPETVEKLRKLLKLE